MAHKYQLVPLLSEVTRRLKSVFTDSFDIWRIHHGGSTNLAALEPHHSVEALNLFRLIGRTDMIPAAFYMCTQLSVETLLRGVLRADGSTLEVLDDSDLERCLEGQYTLRSRQVDMGQDISMLAPPSDVAHSHCDEYIWKFQRFMFDKYYLEASSDPLGNDLLMRLDQSRVEQSICEDCVHLRQNHVYKMQTNLWVELSEMAEAEARAIQTTCPSQRDTSLSPDVDLWCDDGNVVFIAEHAAFRVHRSQLSRHSDVFCDLLGIPQAADDDLRVLPAAFLNLCERCTIIRVPETAYDFKTFLQALYDGGR